MTTNGPRLFDLPLRRLLDDVAARTPDPAGGPVCAIVLGFAAALVVMSARFSGGTWNGAEQAAAQAEALRARVELLAVEDGRAYADVLAALRLPREPDAGERERALALALGRAAEVPLELAGLAAEAAELAVEVAERGNRNLRGDATTAASLAAASARAAANLVAINLAGRGGDPRVERAAAAAARAAAAAERALALPG